MFVRSRYSYVFLAISGVVFIAVGFAVKVVRIPFIVVGAAEIVFAVVLFVMGQGSSKKRSQLRATGVQATATILGIQDTGMTINDNPRVRLILQLDIPGHGSQQVQHTETISRLAVGRLVPGTQILALVDPANPTEFMLDWSSPPPAMGVGVMPGAVAAPQQPQQQFASAADIIARGYPASAYVQNTFETGVTTPDGDPVVGFDLQVTMPGQAAYPVRIGHRVPRSVARPQPGTTLAVKVDPSDATKVAIDWGMSPVH